ncbi:MAG: FtsX-like permease family protein [Methylovulum sp.]|nr:FtsX-like permease family protein [Methylovulum sp.]
MKLFWHKVCSNLTAHKSRTLLAISSIAIGLFIVGALLGMMDMQLADMDKAHQLSRPSHINLILKSDADNALVEHIKNIAGVAQVDTLTQWTVRFKTPGNPAWQTGTALFRPDYRQQHFDRMTLLSGQWPQAQSIAVERLSAKQTGLQLGDAVEFATTTGTVLLTTTGIIRHPFVKPPAFGGQVHFFIAPETAALFGVAPHSFRQLLVQIKPPYNADQARAVAAAVRTELGISGIGVNTTLLQNPEQHWGRPFFAGINLVLTVMAWASLALSCVLILNTVAALITQQTDQIGIMKALGARRGLIARLYLCEVLALALAALACALPLGMAGAYFSSRWLLDLFNIDMNGFEYSPRAVLWTLIGGLLAPLLAALWPIWRGAAMPVRQALASYGLGADFAGHGFDRWLEHKLSRILPTLYAVALGNLLRRKARLLWTQSVLIIAGVLFIVIMSLAASVRLTLDNELARSRYAVRLGFSQDQPWALIDRLVRSVPQTTGVEFWRRLPAELANHNKPLRQAGSLGAQIVALPVTSRLYQPLIVAGRWFDSNDNGQNRLVLNADTAELNGIALGDTLQVSVAQADSTWQVIGLYRWFAGSAYTVEPIYAPLSTIQTLTKRNETSSFALLSAKVETLAEEQTYADTLKQLFQDQHIKLDIYTTIARLEQRLNAENQFRPILSMLLGLAGLIAAVGAIGLSGTLAIGVLQRTREIGVLRAIGASSAAIFKLFILEGVFHGLMAWLISVPIAYLAAGPLSRELGVIMLGIQLDAVFCWLAVWLWLALALVLAILAAYLPARHATKIAVRASLGY